MAINKKEIPDSLAEKLKDWMGLENLKFFKKLKGLTGTYAPVLRLNYSKKGMPAHPVHFREGMQIRNFMRKQEECKDWQGHDFDDNWVFLVEKAVEKYC